MPHKPKSIYCHYKDSLIINSTTLKSFLITHSISIEEAENIITQLSQYYEQKIHMFLSSTNDDDNWTKLESESFPSPLILFICCINKIVIHNKMMLSKRSQSILKSFLNSLEPWMIW
jgi:hypothetical protein